MNQFPQLTFFKESEFLRPGLMTRDTLCFLDQVRSLAGIRISVTSDVRTKWEHERLYPDPDERPNSPHLRGTAVDFRPTIMSQKNRLLVLWAILDVYRQDMDSPFPIYDLLGLEVANGHFHIDFDKELKRPHLWTGVSR